MARHQGEHGYWNEELTSSKRELAEVRALLNEANVEVRNMLTAIMSTGLDLTPFVTPTIKRSFLLERAE
jgi:hypothetical protein